MPLGRERGVRGRDRTEGALHATQGIHGVPTSARTGAAALIVPSPGLDLGLVARSHGWYDLPPFDWDEERHRLSFVFGDGRLAVSVRIVEAPTGVRVASSRGADPAAVRRVVRRALDLEADLSAFHEACRSRDDFRWVAKRRAGRILRSPSLFEDAVKVLATTNCSWALTRVAVRNLVDGWGAGGAFPVAEALAGETEERLRRDARLGYRAPFLLVFAEAVASGRLDLAGWEDRARPDDEVFREIRAQKGFGPYASDTLGRLLGRHGRLGIDSWSRGKVRDLRFGGRKVSDARIERLYAPFGPYAGLAFWLDVTRDWHEGEKPLWP